MDSARDGGGKDQPELSPEQERALGRIQLTGVLIIIAVTLLGGFFRTWQVAVGGLGIMVVVLLVLGLFAARVQRQPFRNLINETNRSIVEDVRRKRTEWVHRIGRRD